MIIIEVTPDVYDQMVSSGAQKEETDEEEKEEEGEEEKGEEEDFDITPSKFTIRSSKSSPSFSPASSVYNTPKSTGKVLKKKKEKKGKDGNESEDFLAESEEEEEGEKEEEEFGSMPGAQPENFMGTIFLNFIIIIISIIFIFHPSLLLILC